MGSIKRKFGNNITSGKFDATDLTGTIPASNVANASLTSVTALPGISGDFIQTVASDPPAPDFGDIWYNSTEQKIKLKVLGTGSWASGGTLNTVKNAMTSASHGSATSGLIFGGQSPGLTGATETYNGTSWTEVNDLNTATTRSLGGGTQTSSISAGGYLGAPGVSSATEEWDGTSWTEVTEFNSPRYAGSGWGANAEALIVVAGSNSGPGSPFGQVGFAEQWNGSSWTETGDLNTARAYITSGFGTDYTSGIVAGGSTASGNDVANAESFNGTIWTEENDLNTGRTQLSGFGTSSSNGYVIGGYNYGPNSGTALTEQWDGTSWTEVADLSTVRWDLAGGGSPTSGLAAGGDTSGGRVNVSEEWTVPSSNQSIQGS